MSKASPMPRSDRRSARVAGLSRAARCAVYLRGGCRCAWCGKALTLRAPVWEPDAATVDHVVPLAAGGATVPDNMVAACAACNTAKNASVRPLTARARRQLARQLDMAAGRLLARTLYPRPGKVAAPMPTAYARFSVYNGPKSVYRSHPRYLEAQAGESPDWRPATHIAEDDYAR